MHTTPSLQDRFRGCLIGGAIGDALGYAVEFVDEKGIARSFGHQGITSYQLHPRSGKALISDDTQMTLFTAAALCLRMGRLKERGVAGDPRNYAAFSYLGWLQTQEEPFAPRSHEDRIGWASWPLLDVPELYSRRAPGNTCLSSLGIRSEQARENNLPKDYLEEPVNNSKGCGGVMRVAPMGLASFGWDILRLDREGAQLAAITHGHPLGYMPAAVLTHIISRIVAPPAPMTLRQIVEEARDMVAALFAGNPYTDQLRQIINAAINLTENDSSDLDNIHSLGEGWVGEEALAIALYCSLKYENDFSRAMIASVNHRGDSDSTGAITGNILGALWGYESLELKWKENLELHDLILQTADRLYETHYCPK